MAATAAAMSGAGSQPGGITKVNAAVGIPFPYSGSGTINAYATVDSYAFTVAYNREITIWVQTSSIGSQLAATLALYDEAGKLLAYNDREFNLSKNKMTDDPILYLDLPAGAYTLAVTSTANFHKPKPLPWQDGTGTTGEYRLLVFGKFDGPAIGDTYEPNNTLPQAYLISLPFQTATANLLYLGDMDWFKFSAKKGQEISVDIDAQELKSQPGFERVVNTRIGVFDQSGKLLQSAATGADPDTGFVGDPSLVFDVPGDGNYFIAVTAAPDTQFRTVFQDPQFLADPHVSSELQLLGYYRLNVRVQSELYFSHVANGSFGEVKFATSMILFNPTEHTATGEVQLFKADGSPMVTEFTGSDPPSDVYHFSIAPGGDLILKTDGKGSGTSGYAVVRSMQPIAGTAIFSQYDGSGALVTEAAVEASQLLDFFAVPVDVSGEFNTGLAVANLVGTTPAYLFVQLQDSSGMTRFSRSLTLDPGKQMAIFVSGKDQLFPSVADFRGNLQVLSDVPVAAVALRTTSNTLTTLPPVPLNQPYQAATMQFPQVVVGLAENYYRTTIILTNPSHFTVSGTAKFTSSDGTPMVVNINSTNSATHRFSVPPQGSLFLETSPANLYSSGYATLDTDHGVGGLVIYSQFDRSTGRLQTEVAVTSAAKYSRFMVLAQNEGDYNTGLAVANLNPGIASLSYSLQPGSDPENRQEKGPVDLGPGKQFAQLLAGANQIFPAFAGNGTLTLTSTQSVYAVALRITATTMTALPVIPIP